jgi:pseudouridine-5'-phosphate glycosidase
LEALETLGVPVLGYRTNEFPGFYTAETGLRLAHRVESPDEVVLAVKAYRSIGYTGAILVAQPPPVSMSAGELGAAIRKSLTEATGKGITGQDVTPFMLSALAEETSGKTLEINRCLLVENARLAARIAQLQKA